jgi:capsular exopolysaccharide synthesis family protein
MAHWQLARRILNGVLVRRKRLLLFGIVAGAAVLLPVTHYMTQQPQRYRTAATILLESRPDRVPLFPEFSPFRPLPVQLAILNSRSLAQSVIENLPQSSLTELLEHRYHIDYLEAANNLYRRLVGLEVEPESPLKRAMNELQKARMKFTARGDGIVEITAEATQPQVAVDIVNTYVEVLLARTRSFNVEDARASREFIEQQLADVKKNLATSEEALRRFTAAQGGIRIPERTQASVQQLAQAEGQLAEVRTNRGLLGARLRTLKERVDAGKSSPPSAPASAPAPAPTPSPEVRKYRDQLAQLESTLLDLRLKFTEEHPRMVLARQQVANLRQRLAEAVKETVHSTPAPGAVPVAERLDFSEQLLALETAFHSMAAQEEALQKQVQTLRDRLTGLSGTELEYARLARETDSHRSLHALLNDKLTAARIREQGEMKVVKVIDPPSFPLSVTSERRIKFFLMALALSLVAGAGLPVAVEWVHRLVENELDVEASTGLPVLALVPRMRSAPPFLAAERHNANGNGHSNGNGNGNGNGHTARRLSRDHFIFTESFRPLRVSAQLAARVGNMRTLLVASPLPGEGKSTVVVNLGLAFAEAGVRVVLADADVARPTLHRLLNVKPSAAGVVDALRADRRIGDCLVPVADKIWMAPRGGAPQHDSRALLATHRLREFVDEIATTADVVVFDSSPVLLVPDGLFLAAAVDGVILVASAGRTSCRDLAQAKAALETAGARVLGVVINEASLATMKSEYARYYSAYMGSQA